MGRTVLAVILGYVAMFVVVMGCLTGAYMLMGADRAFEVRGYEVTSAWLVVWALVTLGAGVVGGVVCGMVGKSKRAVVSLMVFVVVLGGLYAFSMSNAETPAAEDLVRTSQTSSMEAMGKARSPMWVNISNPILGVLGIMIGGRLSGACRDRGRSDAGET